MFTLVLFLLSCQTKKIDSTKFKKIPNPKEFERLIKVKALPKKNIKKTTDKTTNKTTSKTALSKTKIPKGGAKHLPALEDSEGFIGRRPVKDPFREFEKTRFKLTYLGITAGHLDLEIGPFVKVNGRKSYELITRVKSNQAFSFIYSVEDVVKAHLDYKNLTPYDFYLEMKESGQMVTAHGYQNEKEKKAIYWERRYNKEGKLIETRKQWEIPAYSQNVFTGLFYLRTFTFKKGKKLAFRVANKGKNIIVTGEVLRKEKLKTKLGVFDTWVVKPQISIKGAYKPVGDMFLWFTADDRKLLVKIQTDIKIGKIIGYIEEIKR